MPKEEEQQKSIFKKFIPKNFTEKVGSGVTAIFLVFLLIWWVIGWIAVLSSIVCLGFSGSVTEKAVGFIFACTFMGPLFFVYLYYNKNYCRKIYTK